MSDAEIADQTIQIMASQPLLGPEVELKEEIPGEAPAGNDLIKVEERLTMTWDDFERIAEERRQGKHWDKEGVLVDSLAPYLQGRPPTNGELIKIIYGYEFDDDMTLSDEVYYRHCKPPSTETELFRRHTFRKRRYEYLYRPAIKRGNLWFPEKYLPDPEDPEWSWKEGIELHKPAKSAYQLIKAMCSGTQASSDRKKANIRIIATPLTDQRSTQRSHHAQ